MIAGAVWPKRAAPKRNNAIAQHKVVAAAMMSRNFSHNVGSHALANPRLYESVGLTPEARNRLSTFHSYTQGRLDFMARAMSSVNERPEPLFFISDVMNGFFRQGVLLNTLVADAGFSAEKIKFIVQLLLSKEQLHRFEFEWRQDEHRFVSKSSNVEDVLVGVPGGNTGCHALYAFLENLLRNSVKYGVKTHCTEQLELTLSLGKYLLPQDDPKDTLKDAWILSITDNVSTDDDFKVSTTIRKNIDTPLVDDEGNPNIAGHGIQEMKVCAEILSGGFRFRADCDHSPHINKAFCSFDRDYTSYCADAERADAERADAERADAERADAERADAERADAERADAERADAERADAERADAERADAKKEKKWVEMKERWPLHCLSTQKDQQAKFLTYHLLLPAPTLIGIVSVDQISNTGQQELPDFVRIYKKMDEAGRESKRLLDKLAKNGAYFGIILDRRQQMEEENNIRDILKEIGDIHCALPYRLLVITNTEPVCKIWEEQLRQLEGREANKPFGKGRIPHRRVRIVCDPKLATLLAGDAENQVKDFTYLGTSGWEAVVLRVYDAWLLAFKGEPPSPDDKTWKLCVGFERSPGQIFGENNRKPWDELVSNFGKDQESCVSIFVRAVEDENFKSARKSARKSANWPKNYYDGKTESLPEKVIANETSADFDKKSFLVFDNHGKTFKGVGKNTDFMSASRFYQEVGFNSGLSLYQSLESPPNEPFSFAFFVYTLVEAALTKVAILDERFAQAVIKKKAIEEEVIKENIKEKVTKEKAFLLTGKEACFHNAGLFPIFRVDGIFISDILEDAANNTTQ